MSLHRKAKPATKLSPYYQRYHFLQKCSQCSLKWARFNLELVVNLHNCKCSRPDWTGLVEAAWPGLAAWGRRVGLWWFLPTQLFYGSLKEDINNEGVWGKPYFCWPKKILHHRYFTLWKALAKVVGWKGTKPSFSHWALRLSARLGAVADEEAAEMAHMAFSLVQPI